MNYTRKIFMLPTPERMWTSDRKGNGGWTTEIGTRHIRMVDMFEAEGSGLGYYIDPANPSGYPKSSQEARGGRDWYTTIHLASGNPVDALFFYQEEDVKSFIDLIAIMVDWNKPLTELQRLPEWTTSLTTKLRRVAQAITTDFLVIEHKS
jgi:hypothetical protein